MSESQNCNIVFELDDKLFQGVPGQCSAFGSGTIEGSGGCRGLKVRAVRDNRKKNTLRCDWAEEPCTHNKLQLFDLQLPDMNRAGQQPQPGKPRDPSPP
eukprot:4144840-Amphidinium_carterae.2